MEDEKELKSPASKFGQIIGNNFEEVVIDFVRDYLDQQYPDYELLQPQEGKKMITLEMLGGLPRQMDNVIVSRDSDDPVALLETKWLKDARHHNDKGAWILQLREVRKRHPTIRGASAVLAGHWTEGVGLMLMSEGGIKMVLVATDEQVYKTLQPLLDEFLGQESFALEPEIMRKSYPRPAELLRFITHLNNTGSLKAIAKSWLQCERITIAGTFLGADLVKNAIDELLKPLPPNPVIRKFEIALQIDTGNTIYKEFTDLEEAQEFMQQYFGNPQAILNQITPKKKH